MSHESSYGFLVDNSHSVDRFGSVIPNDWQGGVSEANDHGNGFADDGDQERWTVHVEVDPRDLNALALAELESLIFSIYQLPKDEMAREATSLYVASGLKDHIQSLQEEGLAFTGLTPEETTGFVDVMHEAHPDASEQKLMEIVTELVDYIKELQAKRVQGTDDSESDPDFSARYSDDRAQEVVVSPDKL